jgi:hypothetical protein
MKEQPASKEREMYKHGWWLISSNGLVLCEDRRFRFLALRNQPISPEIPEEAKVTEKGVHWFPDQGAAAEYLQVILDAKGEGFSWWDIRRRCWQPSTESLFLRLCRTDHLADLFNADHGQVEADMDPEGN